VLNLKPHWVARGVLPVPRDPKERAGCAALDRTRLFHAGCGKSHLL
jgi:hypothetical protein